MNIILAAAIAQAAPQHHRELVDHSPAILSPNGQPTCTGGG